MPTCHLCSLDGLYLVPFYEALHRVTSDCKPWRAGGQLAVCPRCGTAQAIISPTWEEEARQIYDRYTIYHQSGGAEQSVFDATTGAASSRSSRLLDRLAQEVPFATRGRLLDVGCGNGNTLRAFNRIAPGWSTAGLDVSDHSRKEVESVPGVEALYTGGINSVPGQFQIITLIHSLEHIAGPAQFLISLRDKLAPDGLLVVQVPDCWQNPFMFLVADHATHFFESTLRDLVASAGYEIVVSADNWIAKELTLVARKAAQRDSTPAQSNAEENTFGAVRRRVEWVVTLGQQSCSLAAKGALGILGTSIAATWLQEELDGKAPFFVDEDPGRFGQVFMERPILRPGEVAAGSQVMIALPAPMAEQVRLRLAQQAPNVNWLVPPALPER